MTASLAPSTVRDIVKRYARSIGVPGLACHDLRRTMSRLARDGGAPLEVIQATLGHSSITTTERYLKTTETANAGEWIKL